MTGRIFPENTILPSDQLRTPYLIFILNQASNYY